MKDVMPLKYLEHESCHTLTCKAADVPRQAKLGPFRDLPGPWAALQLRRQKEVTFLLPTRSKAERGPPKHRRPSQETMLSRALQKANTAVLLDNAQNFEGAMEAYADACHLLQQVMRGSTRDEDKKKLKAIVRYELPSDDRIIDVTSGEPTQAE
jgi:MIT (microtubule interacting and transport) domain